MILYILLLSLIIPLNIYWPYLMSMCHLLPLNVRVRRNKTYLLKFAD